MVAATTVPPASRGWLRISLVIIAGMETWLGLYDFPGAFDLHMLHCRLRSSLSTPNWLSTRSLLSPHGPDRQGKGRYPLASAFDGTGFNPNTPF